ncbi:TetR/AcrR family transcriptional regulator [Nocardia sp. CA2R105]|uniref:TetR/AcrR family transcriptional regulator n=1 Tax=Nocardia jiangxiensis TaxID=282685 RepID=A0ABW6RYS5_9NOCA|nr:TetR/AcrR family transcriptional regulator [Nocardia coffeae]MBY8856845.1 TetR/AcrR family transcriptional regulator [Nocardia coffeae]
MTPARRPAAKKASPRARVQPEEQRSEAFSQRRQAMLEVAAELFAEQGFRSTTVRQIGTAAGVLSGSLYHHFESKEAIADDILSSYFDGLLTTYKEIIAENDNPGTTLRELIRAAFASLGPHRAAITVLQNEGEYLRQFPRFAYLTKMENDIRRMWVKVLEEGVELDLFRDDLDPRITYRFIRDSIWVVVRWFAPSGRLSSDQLAEEYIKLTMGGLEKS